MSEEGAAYVVQLLISIIDYRQWIIKIVNSHQRLFCHFIICSK